MDCIDQRSQPVALSPRDAVLPVPGEPVRPAQRVPTVERVALLLQQELIGIAVRVARAWSRGVGPLSILVAGENDRDSSALHHSAVHARQHRIARQQAPKLRDELRFAGLEVEPEQERLAVAVHRAELVHAGLQRIEIELAKRAGEGATLVPDPKLAIAQPGIRLAAPLAEPQR